jgi:hypothetical protein
VRLLDLDQFRKVVRQHGLVARDDRDAAQQSPLDDAVCGIGLVDHLHDQVDVPVVEYLVDRRREEGFVDLDLARFFRVADADLHDLRVGVLRFLHYLVDSLSDDAEPEQADFDFAHMLLVY